MSGSWIMPLGADFSDLYPNLYGLSLDYIFGGDRSGFSLQVGCFFAGNTLENNEEVYVFLNSYSLGVRYYMPKIFSLFLYTGILARVTWCGEASPDESANFTGIGSDLFLGMDIPIQDSLGFFIQYNASLGMVLDENETNISAHILFAGAVYTFRS